jgi:glycosyltransferase involved in cell wall biosynthesis
MRIGVVVQDRNPNPQYRALLPMEELSRRGHLVGTAVLDGTFDRLPPADAFLDFDVVYFWRLFEEPVRRIAHRLRDAGVAVIWDNDDNIAAVPRGVPNYRFHGGMIGQREWGEMRSMMKLADAVTTPSPHLAERYRNTGHPNVHVIENYLPAIGAAPRGGRRRAHQFVVGWVAGSEHIVDERDLKLSEVARRLLAARDDVVIVTVGVRLRLEDPRYQYVQFVPLDELANVVAQFDVGLAPLTDIPFNRARSNLKVKEYAAQGVPWLASPIGPYADLGEEQGGWLVDDGAWLETLLELIDDGGARRALGKAAHRWACGETLALNAERWETVLEGAVARASGAVAR